MRKLYVCSKPFPDENGELRPRLIGILTELKPGVSPRQNGEYQFEYKLGGTFPEDIVRLTSFPDINKTYKGFEVMGFMKKWLPSHDFDGLDDILKRAETSFENYDEWAVLKTFALSDGQKHAYLYETLPKDVIMYERL